MISLFISISIIYIYIERERDTHVYVIISISSMKPSLIGLLGTPSAGALSKMVMNGYTSYTN